MSKTIRIGDQVCVPVERVARGSNCPYPIVTGYVSARNGRTLTVNNLPYGIGTVQIASSAVHEANLSVSIVRIGDFASETTLLDPITKSISHYLRLLLPDDRLRTHYIRSLDELNRLWTDHSNGVSHFIIVGHASGADLLFATDGAVNSSDVAARLIPVIGAGSDFVLLCCESGKVNFARPFSNAACCRNLIAPMGKLHGASATQFATTFFAQMLLEGDSTRVAYKAAVNCTPGGPNFRHWVNGNHLKL